MISPFWFAVAVVGFGTAAVLVVRVILEAIARDRAQEEQRRTAEADAKLQAFVGEGRRVVVSPWDNATPKQARPDEPPLRTIKE